MFSGRFFGSWRGGRRAAFFAVCEGRLHDTARRKKRNLWNGMRAWRIAICRFFYATCHI